MALEDLLGSIESFDYNQVGLPQSFEANNGVVTGQQTFDRPLEEPLPISETLGYGLRTSSQNFIEDTFANGFTANMSSTQFNFIEGNQTAIVDEVSFGDITYVFGAEEIVFQNNLAIQNSIAFTGFAGDDDFRRQSSRIADWVTTPSNFLAEDSTTAANTSLNLDYVEQHNIMVDGLSLSTGRVIQYPTNYTDKQMTNEEGGFHQLRPNRLEQFAEDYFVTQDRIMLMSDGGDTTTLKQYLSSKKQKGADEFIRELSPGNHPFIIKKIGSSYGLPDMPDLGPSVAQNVVEWIGKGINLLDNMAGGFVRGTPDTISGRVHREFDDALRKGKFIISGTGLLFGLKQFGLQLFNRTIETRIWNPVSLFSTDFYHMKRHVGGLEYGALMKDPKEALKDAAPAFLEPLVDPIIKAVFPTIGDGKSTSRAVFQVDWHSKQDAPKLPISDSSELSFSLDGAANLASNIGGAIVNAVSSGVNSMLADGKIALHNPNHYLRIGGILDPYAGPEGGTPIEDVSTIKKKITTPDQGATTFYDPSDLTPSAKEKYNNYSFKTYGQIRDAADDKNESRNRYEVGYEENVVGKAPTNPVTPGMIKLPPGGMTQEVYDKRKQAKKDYKEDLKAWTERKKNFDGSLGQDLKLQKRFYERFNPGADEGPADYVNSYPLVREEGGLAYDFIDFYFKTRQWTGAKRDIRYLQFSAILNNINESVTPEYNEQRYLGRPDKYYTYNGVDRDVTLEFTIYPHSKTELPYLMEKLNYLVGLCYPQYSSEGFMIAPQVDLTVGHMFREQPGYINQLAINVQDNTTWETDLFQFPKHITANLTFRYFGKHIPHQFGKHYDVPYLQPFTGGDKTNTDKPQQVGALGSELTYKANADSTEVDLYKKSITRRRPVAGIPEEIVKEIGEASVKREIGSDG